MVTAAVAAFLVTLVDIEFQVFATVGAFDAALHQGFLVHAEFFVAVGAGHIVKLAVPVFVAAFIAAALAFVVIVKIAFQRIQILVDGIHLLGQLGRVILQILYAQGQIRQNVGNRFEQLAFLGILVDGHTFGQPFQIGNLFCDSHVLSLL